MISYVMKICLLLSIFSVFVYGDIADQTCFTNNPLRSLGPIADTTFISSFIEYVEDPQTLSITFGRVVDTGSGNNIQLRSYTPEHGKHFRDKRYYYRQFLSESAGSHRVGAFFCNVTGLRNQMSSSYIPLIILANEAYIKPEKQTQTVSFGETVTIKMHLMEGYADDLRWRHDGNVIDHWSGLTTITIPYVTKDDGGIYECYLNGSRQESKHAIVRLIVRGCSASRWGADCQYLCPTCYNSGVCDDVSGLCVCPPGFKGQDCSEGCGNNQWGRLCAHVCSSSNPGCPGHMGCVPDPLGCSCMAGYKGLNCEGTCETTGYYGSTCSEQCHCAAGVTCDPSRGCPDGPCEPGYSGINCQVPNECTGGWYGDLCKYQCHCEDDGPCDRNTGSCGDRKCKNLWIGSDCQLDGRTNVNLVVPSSNRGTLLTITCIVQANPIPRDEDIKVLHGDVVLGNGVSTVTEWNYTTTIVFSDINIKEDDFFKCQVQSDISGNAKTEEAVTIYDPPVMTTKPNVIVSNSTVTISWNEWTATGQNGDGPLIGYSVCYRQTAEKWKPCSELVTGLSITYNIEAYGEDGLHRGVDYELGVRAVRPGNLGNANMSPLTQLVIPCLLPDAVQNVKMESRKNSITITWTSPEAEHCKIDFYKLKYKLQNQCLCAKNQNEDESTVWLSETSHTITSLEAYTSYIINISAVTHQLKDDQYLEGLITTVNATTSEEDFQKQFPASFVVGMMFVGVLIGIVLTLFTCFVFSKVRISNPRILKSRDDKRLEVTKSKDGKQQELQEYATYSADENNDNTYQEIQMKDDTHQVYVNVSAKKDTN